MRQKAVWPEAVHAACRVPGQKVSEELRRFDLSQLPGIGQTFGVGADAHPLYGKRCCAYQVRAAATAYMQVTIVNVWAATRSDAGGVDADAHSQGDTPRACDAAARRTQLCHAPEAHENL
jgi:hypothetical protein